MASFQIFNEPKECGAGVGSSHEITIPTDGCCYVDERGTCAAHIASPESDRGRCQKSHYKIHESDKHSNRMSLRLRHRRLGLASTVQVLAWRQPTLSRSDAAQRIIQFWRDVKQSLRQICASLPRQSQGRSLSLTLSRGQSDGRTTRGSRGK